MGVRYSQKANLLAGGFLLGGVALAVVISFVLADISLSSTRQYFIDFSLEDGATGLSPDAAVRVGGQQVGKVAHVAIVKDKKESYRIQVEVSIRPDIELYEDAWAYLEVPLLGTSSTINIPYVGTGSEVVSPQGGSPRLQAGEHLQGSIAPPTFLANAGFGPTQRDQIQRMLADAQVSIEDLRKAIETIRPRIVPVADDVQATVASARRSAEGFEQDATQWRSDISTTLSNAKDFSDRLESLDDEAKLTLNDAREMIRSGQAVIENNRDRIDNILASTETAAAGIRDDWIPKGSALLDQARSGVDRYTSVGKKVDTLLTDQTPSIEQTLANIRIASDQIKFLAIEARAQPWRLLHRPDTKELNNQLLYDAARSYAMAVGDLRATSQSLDALVHESAIRGEVDLDELAAMRKKLSQAFATYSAKESELLDRMIESQH